MIIVIQPDLITLQSSYYFHSISDFYGWQLSIERKSILIFQKSSIE